MKPSAHRKRVGTPAKFAPPAKDRSVDVRLVPCPECEAPVGVHCESANGQHVQHRSRRRIAIRAGAFVQSPPKVVSECDLDGCGEPGYFRGMCQKHYVRWRRNGDPNVVLDRYDPKGLAPLCRQGLADLATAGLSPTVVAARIGVSPRAVKSWAAGTSKPRTELAERLLALVAEVAR